MQAETKPGTRGGRTPSLTRHLRDKYNMSPERAEQVVENTYLAQEGLSDDDITRRRLTRQFRAHIQQSALNHQ